MKRFLVIAFLFLNVIFLSCKTSITHYATQWTQDIKKKIIEDSNRKPDKIQIDSSTVKIVLYKGDRKLKYFKLDVDDMRKYVPSDTVVSVFYSDNQNFELVRELCPSISRSYEGIKYKGQSVGLTEFKYCNGKIMKRGFRFYNDIGIWEEYDTSGKLIGKIDYHELKRLEMLKEIKYYR